MYILKCRLKWRGLVGSDAAAQAYIVESMNNMPLGRLFVALWIFQCSFSGSLLCALLDLCIKLREHLL